MDSPKPVTISLTQFPMRQQNTVSEKMGYQGGSILKKIVSTYQSIKVSRMFKP